MKTAINHELQHSIETASQLEFGEALIHCAEIFKHRKIAAEELIFCPVENEAARQSLMETFNYCNKQLKLILGIWEENTDEK